MHRSATTAHRGCTKSCSYAIIRWVVISRPADAPARHPGTSRQDQVPTRSAPPARRPEIVDLVQRDFHADVPNTLWFTDITQIRTGQGWLYAAVIFDAFNREVISWAIATLDTPTSVLAALNEAIMILRPARGASSTPTAVISSLPRIGSISPTVQRPASLDRRTRSSCYDNAVWSPRSPRSRIEEIYPKRSHRSPKKKPAPDSSTTSVLTTPTCIHSIPRLCRHRVPTQHNQVTVREIEQADSTTDNPGPTAAGPTWPTRSRCATNTTNGSTTPASTTRPCPTAASDSAGAREAGDARSAARSLSAGCGGTFRSGGR